MSAHVHRRSANPRHDYRCDCGHMIDTPAHELGCDRRRELQASDSKRGDYETYIDRDIEHERLLSGLAAESRGFLRIGADGMPEGDTGGLDEFADARAWSGGVRANINAVREAQEELADCRHYLIWGAQQVEGAYRRGDSEGAEQYARLMRALAAVIEAWHALAGSTRGAS